jgi:hypothetical protein
MGHLALLKKGWFINSVMFSEFASDFVQFWIYIVGKQNAGCASLKCTAPALKAAEDRSYGLMKNLYVDQSDLVQVGLQ